MSSIQSIQEAIKHWGHLAPYAHIPANDAEYTKMLAFVEALMDWLRHHKNERATTLLNLVARNIEAYENRHYATKKTSPIEVLKLLMNEHGLGQGDLPEIGSQSLVSKILNGERQLTVDHIRYLSKRFGVSPSVFF